MGGAARLLQRPQAAALYQAPGNQNLMITDLTLSNFDTMDAVVDFFSAQGTCAHVLKYRLRHLAVPPEQTVHLPYQTGMGFAAGSLVCAQVLNTISLTARGFHFTAAPAP